MNSLASVKKEDNRIVCQGLLSGSAQSAPIKENSRPILR